MPTMQELRERLTAEQRQQIEDAHAEYLASLPENVRNYLEERRREALQIDPKPRRRPGGMWAYPTPMALIR